MCVPVLLTPRQYDKWDITHSGAAALHVIFVALPPMANTIRLTGTPDGNYWIRVQESDLRETVRQLRGPYQSKQIFQNLLSVGLNEGQANMLVIDAQQSRTATIHGVALRAPLKLLTFDHTSIL
jgi:hypothetical protein